MRILTWCPVVALDTSSASTIIGTVSEAVPERRDRPPRRRWDRAGLPAIDTQPGYDVRAV